MFAITHAWMHFLQTLRGGGDRPETSLSALLMWRLTLELLSCTIVMAQEALFIPCTGCIKASNYLYSLGLKTIIYKIPALFFFTTKRGKLVNISAAPEDNAHN